MWELGPWKTKYQKGDSGPGTTLFISAEIVVFFLPNFHQYITTAAFCKEQSNNHFLKRDFNCATLLTRKLATVKHIFYNTTFTK